MRGAAAIALAWAALAWLGAPFFYIDDGYFLQPALSLLRHGDLRAPGLALYFPDFSGNMLVYPPLHNFLLAGAVAVLGASPLALKLLACGLGLVATLAVYAILLRRVLLPPAMAAAAALALMVPGHVYTSLRPEMTGFPLLALGLAVAGGSLARIGAATLLVGLACMAAPTLAGFALAFGLLGMHGLGRRGLLDGRVLAMLAAVAGLLGGLFLLTIDFQLETFLRQFSLHAQARRGSLDVGLNEATLRLLGVLLAGGLAWLALFRRPADAIGRARLAALAFLLVALPAVVLSHGRPTAVLLAQNGAILLACLCLARAGAARLAMPAGWALLGFVAVLNLAYLRHLPAQRVAPQAQAAIGAAIAERPPGGRLLVSGMLLLPALGGVWPEGALDLRFAEPFTEPYSMPNGLNALGADDLVIASSIDLATIASLPAARVGDRQAYQRIMFGPGVATDPAALRVLARWFVPVELWLPPRAPLRLCILRRGAEDLDAQPLGAVLARFCGP